MNICRILTASGICHVMKQKNTFRICIPRIDNFVVCCTVRIKPNTAAVRCHHIIRKPLYVNRQPAIQPVAEPYFYRIPKIYTENQRLHFLVRLRRHLLKSADCLFLYSLRIFFQDVQKTVRIIISVSIIYNRNLYRLYCKTTSPALAGIFT